MINYMLILIFRRPIFLLCECHFHLDLKEATYCESLNLRSGICFSKFMCLSCNVAKIFIKGAKFSQRELIEIYVDNKSTIGL